MSTLGCCWQPLIKRKAFCVRPNSSRNRSLLPSGCYLSEVYREVSMKYSFVPISQRKPLRWPNGKRLTLMITTNLA
jgi:hypothetical protein